VQEAGSLLLIGLGVGFFLGGSLGMLRFPDVHSRLHALTKADNLGLGLIVAGLVLRAPSPAAGVKLVLIWLLALMSSSTIAYAIAHATRGRREPGRSGGDDRQRP
jgi:multicomponent Na+:H+ antiporter subunit G